MIFDLNYWLDSVGFYPTIEGCLLFVIMILVYSLVLLLILGFVSSVVYHLLVFFRSLNAPDYLDADWSVVEE